MRNLMFPLVAIGVVVLLAMMQSDYPVQYAPTIETESSSPTLPAVLELQQVEESRVDEAIDPWLVKPTPAHSVYCPDAESNAVQLVATQAETLQGWEQGSDESERIEKLEKQVAELTKLKSEGFDTAKRLDGLEDRMAKAESDVTDLSNGQADLTKAVEELRALIEIRCPDGKVKTATVAVDESGTGEIKLAPGEILQSIDGVPVNTLNSFSGGSNGTAVASTQSVVRANYGTATYPATSGGSNGSVQYQSVPMAATTTYSTSTYSAQSMPVSGGSNVVLTRRPATGRLRSGNGPLQNLRGTSRTRTANGVCYGPDCR